MELATKDDLTKFKEDILSGIKSLLQERHTQPKPYLKSREVMEMLGCSESKLASLRTSGQLPCNKIQGTYYYKSDDISKLMTTI
jgi:hypothetical protein